MFSLLASPHPPPAEPNRYRTGIAIDPITDRFDSTARPLVNNPYAPGTETSHSAFEPNGWKATRWTVALTVATASLGLCFFASWYTEFEPLILIDLVFLWLCVFAVNSIATIRWGLLGFAVSLLLSPATGFLALILAFVTAAMLGYEVMPVPN